MIKALVAVRAGSERVSNKNTRPFAGQSLLYYKLKQLLGLACMDGVVVNSEDETMLKMAGDMGCEIVQRDPYYARSETCMSDVYHDMAVHFPGDVVVYCNVTSPLITDQSIASAVELYQREPHSDGFSVNSAHLIKEFLYFNGKPLNYDPLRQPRSQDLPDIFALNFAVSVISAADMAALRNIIAPRHRLLSLSEEEAVDIDSDYDFRIAEFLFKGRNGRHGKC